MANLTAEQIKNLNEPTPVTYSESDLESKALNYLKRIRGKDYKAMSKAEVNEWAVLKAKAARGYAESLMATGEPDFIAWNRAIRLEILESETD